MQPEVKAHAGGDADRSGGSAGSQSELVQPHTHLPAVRFAVPENKDNPADDGAEHDSHECVCHFRAPVRAGHETRPFYLKTVLRPACAGFARVARARQGVAVALFAGSDSGVL
jgi:hypothetical protein